MRITQAVILVGGLGTRLGDLTRTTPKPMLDVDGRPFVEHVIAHLTRFGVTKVLLLAGFRGEMVLETYDGRDLHGARLSVVVEPEPLGTGGGLKLVADRLDPLFLMSNGDTFFDADLLPLLHVSSRSEAAASLILRNEPDCRRYGSVDCLPDGRVTRFREKSSGPDPQCGLVNAGTYLLRRDAVLSEVDHCPCSFETHILPNLVAKGAVTATVGNGYFIDIGIPDALAAARSGLRAARMRPAVFLDRDGVLNVDHGYTHRVEDLVLIDGAIDAVRLLNDSGHYVIVVSNQAGVARGYYEEPAIHVFNSALRDRLMQSGARIDAFYHCPHHPAGSVPHLSIPCACRKPSAGMLERAAEDWPIDLARSFLVGDNDTDLGAATAFGISGFKFAGGNLQAAVEAALDAKQASQKPTRTMTRSS